MSQLAREKVIETLYSGFIGQGPKVEEFEKELQSYVDNPHVLTTNNGTSALQLALRLVGVRGKKVITTPMTCTATNWPILAEGADIVWADIDRETGNISYDSVIELLTEDVVAIMAVDWGGYPIDHSKFDTLPVPVIEDAAHAFGSRWFGKLTGSLSQYTTFSFQAIKHLTCGDGGALCVLNEEDYRRGKLIRWYGIDREQPRADFRCEEDIHEWGYKFHMNDISASIGLSNLPCVDYVLDCHRQNAWYYNKTLTNCTVHKQSKGILSSYWLYTIFVEDRDDFIRKMAEHGIATSRVHERNDKHSCVSKYKSRELPNLEWFTKHEVCIPVGWWVTSEDREFISEKINEGW